MRKVNYFYSLTAILLLMLTSGHLCAQSPVHFGIGPEAGIPTGSTSDTYAVDAGVSLNVRAALPVNNLYIIGSIAYQQWFVKRRVEDFYESGGYDVSNLGILPIRVGARYGFGSSPFYVKFDLGPAVVLKNPIKGEDNGTLMSYAPGIGAKFGVLDAELKFDIFSKNGESLHSFGLKVAYYF